MDSPREVLPAGYQSAYRSAGLGLAYTNHSNGFNRFTMNRLFRGTSFGLRLLDLAANAGAAHTGSCPPYVSVGFVERMPMNTMCLTGRDGTRAGAPKDVHFIRDWLQMRWIDADAIPTEMIEGKAHGNRANQQFIGKAMGILPNPAITTYPTASPLPAPRRLSDNPTPEAVAECGSSVERVAMRSPTLIVHGAPATNVMGELAAIWNATLGLHRKVRPFVAALPVVQATRGLSFVTFHLAHIVEILPALPYTLGHDDRPMPCLLVVTYLLSPPALYPWQIRLVNS